MRIPERVKIGGLEYRVVFDGNLLLDHRLFGRTHFVRQEITIDSNTTPTKQMETLLHEIIEAIDQSCDLDLEHHKIQTLAFQLHQVLKDNRLVFFDDQEAVSNGTQER